MHRFVTALVALALVAGVTATADAQLRPVLSIAGGASLPQDGILNEMEMNTGWYGAVGVTFRAPLLPAGLRVEGLYTRLAIDDYSDGINSLKVNAGILGGTVNAVFGMGALGFRPYAIVGGGMYNVKMNVKGSFEELGSFEGSESEMKPGVNGGLGMELPLGGLFVEARYHAIFTPEERTNFVPVTFGLRF